jgi:hypothetical protein
MWSRIASLLVLVAAATTAAWIAVHGVLWVDRDSGVLALASGWEVAILGLLAATAVWALGALRGRPRLVVCGGILALLTTLLLRDLAPRGPEVREPGEGSVERPAVRTLWICVDGLSWSKVLPLVADGRMPHMARLLASGSAALLESEPTYRESVDRWGWWSPVVWTTLATGRGPAAHGITDFSLPDPSRRPRDDGTPRLRAAASFHRRVPAFWNLFSAFGRRVGVVGWWASWPAEEVEGVLVTDRVGLRSRRDLVGLEQDPGVEWFRRQEGLVHPVPFLNLMAEEIGLPDHPEAWVESELYPFRQRPIVGHRDLSTIHAVLWQDQLYARVAEHLLRERRDLDLTTVYVEGIDVLSHQFWHYMADPEAQPGLPGIDEGEGYRLIVDRYHEAVDASLGQLLEAAGDPVRVVLTSDHGFRMTPGGEHPADHSAFGTLVLAGEGVRRGKTALTLAGLLAAPVSVLDVLPTLLYWNGLPIADELEGEPLYRFFRRDYLRAHPAVRIDSYGEFDASREVEIPLPDASDEEYLERLKALGYIQ